MKKVNYFFKRTLLASLLMFILCSQDPLMVMAQTSTGDSTGAVRSRKFDTRSLALGSATIADQHGGVGIGINAAVSGLGGKQPVLYSDSYHNWDTNLMQHNLTLPALPYNAHHIVLRLGVLHNGLDEVNPSGSSSFPEPDITGYEVDIAYAFAVTDAFSVGLLQQISRISNDDEQFWIYTADLSLIYAPDGPVSYGMAFRGIGREGTFEILRTGETDLSTSNQKPGFELGLTYRYPDEERSYFSVSLANEKRFGEEDIWYKGGLELLPVSFLALRGGILFQIDEDVVLPRAGLGLKTGFLNLDYVIAPDDFSGEQFHQLGITIKL